MKKQKQGKVQGKPLTSETMEQRQDRAIREIHRWQFRKFKSAHKYE